MPLYDKPTRRAVLSLAPAAAASATLAATGEAEGAAPQEDDPRRLRYEETPHIRDYYRLARG